jgi:hypothetical protein
MEAEYCPAQNPAARLVNDGMWQPENLEISLAGLLTPVVGSVVDST